MRKRIINPVWHRVKQIGQELHTLPLQENEMQNLGCLGQDSLLNFNSEEVSSHYRFCVECF